MVMPMVPTIQQNILCALGNGGRTLLCASLCSLKLVVKQRKEVGTSALLLTQSQDAKKISVALGKSAVLPDKGKISCPRNQHRNKKKFSKTVFDGSIEGSFTSK